MDKLDELKLLIRALEGVNYDLGELKPHPEERETTSRLLGERQRTRTKIFGILELKFNEANEKVN